MFRRIQQYELIEVDGRWYRPRAYGDPQPDGTWNGWVIFFPVGRGIAIAPPSPETTQRTEAALAVWATELTTLHLEGALARALGLLDQPQIIARLSDAEYEALEDAERLETAAELDDAAAKSARSDADALRRDRLATESAVAATEKETAKVEATVHEQAAQDARAVAADASRRRRSADAEATALTHTKRRGSKNKKK
jgi:hypothetical protein